MELNRQRPGQPYGYSTPIEWDGEGRIIEIESNCARADGVSTSVAMLLRPRGPLNDGTIGLGHAREVRTFSAPGRYECNVPPGVVQFVGSGPPGWTASVTIEDLPPAPKSQKPTIEQRVAALEQSVHA